MKVMQLKLHLAKVSATLVVAKNMERKKKQPKFKKHAFCTLKTHQDVAVFLKIYIKEIGIGLEKMIYIFGNKTIFQQLNFFPTINSIKNFFVFEKLKTERVKKN